MYFHVKFFTNEGFNKVAFFLIVFIYPSKLKIPNNIDITKRYYLYLFSLKYRLENANLETFLPYVFHVASVEPKYF